MFGYQTSPKYQTRLAGAFTGFHADAVFRLANGQVWQQRRYKYRYKYAYRPEAVIYAEGGRYFLNVPIMGESIEVVRVSIACEDEIVSNFKGFNGNAVFEFNNGQVWYQSEYKYDYHYAYRPHAMVIDGLNGKTLHVDGMNETVRVRR